jgi:Methyltransferase domain
LADTSDEAGPDWDNRPTPLEEPPIQLLGDDLWQMSFGERAALEGILAQARPGLAFEIGTHRGGSLRRIAAHSTEVHTVDIIDLVESRSAFPNVAFHVGDSREVVPRVLSELTRAGRQVDFVLIDGDHSTDGVRVDLENVLASPATAETIIVLHDAGNDEVRRGIEAAEPDARPGVLYCDLDFLPGYTFARGEMRGQTWGGLGLLVTAARPAAGHTARQDLYEDRLTRGADVAELRMEAEDLRRELAVMRDSWSWRLTAPLRAGMAALQRRRSH